MAAYRPVAGEHAVEQAIVGVRWRKKPTDDEFNAAIQKAGEIADQFALPGKLLLDAFSLIANRQTISFGFDGPAEPLPGYVFQQVRPDGTMAQEMTVERSAVTFRTRNYKRWSDIQEIIRGAICPIADAICAGDISEIGVIEFRCVDRFIADGNTIPPLSDLIRDDTDLIANRVKGCSSYFHSHIGWFEEQSQNERYLYNVNVTIQNDEANGRPSANILQIISRQLRSSPSEEVSVPAIIEQTFDDLHARDKALLTDLLTQGVVDAINLKGTSEAVTA